MFETLKNNQGREKAGTDLGSELEVYRGKVAISTVFYISLRRHSLTDF